jgi:hypothetical protein
MFSWQYIDGATDDGGVHVNSGIHNKAAYLMAEGGTFHGRTIDGIGRAHTGVLMYNVMRFLTKFATFEDARDLAVAKATQWAENGTGGFSHHDLCQVRNAYAAVGVGAGDHDCDGDDTEFEDTDGDGNQDIYDNCVHVQNHGQQDADNDGIGDACDCDQDGNGVHDYFDRCKSVCDPPALMDSDGDGLADVCDPDGDGDGVDDTIDNCVDEANPDQEDGNGDGYGDACDPDFDGDAAYGAEDNCQFVANPDQADSDADGLGDACDKCPLTPDNAGAWSFGLGGVPEPKQPDSDGDGLPDACDRSPFFGSSAFVDGVRYSSLQTFHADGRGRTLTVRGADVVRLDLPVCEDDRTPAADERFEAAFGKVRGDFTALVRDDRGAVVARLAGGVLRFRADCTRRYRLELRATGREAAVDATVTAAYVVPSSDAAEPVTVRR